MRDLQHLNSLSQIPDGMVLDDDLQQQLIKSYVHPDVSSLYLSNLVEVNSNVIKYEAAHTYVDFPENVPWKVHEIAGHRFPLARRPRKAKTQPIMTAIVSQKHNPIICDCASSDFELATSRVI